MSHDWASTSTTSEVISATYVEKVIKAIADRMQYSQENQRVLEQQVKPIDHTHVGSVVATIQPLNALQRNWNLYMENL